MDCSLPGSSVHGILQTRILEWVAVPFSKGSSQPRDWTWVSCIAGRLFTIWASREAQVYCIGYHVLQQDLPRPGSSFTKFQQDVLLLLKTKYLLSLFRPSRVFKFIVYLILVHLHNKLILYMKILKFREVRWLAHSNSNTCDPNLYNTFA